MNRWLMVAGLAAALSVSAQAQDRNNGNNNRQDRGNRGPGGGNFDPARMQQFMMDRVKEQLEITDDNEWKAIQPLVQKVMDARMASMSGMRGMFGRRGGDRGPDGGDQNRDRRGPFGQTPSPEVEALQKAIDGKASNSEMKAVIAKVQDSRKAKQADLEKAQADLRKVLSVRQEAIATLNGWL
jgi:hypothetical protein